VVKKTQLPKGLLPVEVLHIDTADSRRLFKESGANEFDKGDGLKLLKNDFAACCRRHGGVVRHWAGDGGFAFFLSTHNVGRSVAAAEAFIENIPHLNAATAIRLGAQSFGWEFRICAHRGEVLLSASVGIESADPENLDDFLKYAKRFAPVTDEFFITQHLYAAVAARVKKRFELFKATVTAGDLHCGLYRLKRAPVAHADDILKHGDEVSEISPQEWSYLRATIRADRENVAARNLITKGLIQSIDSPPARRTEADICEKRLLQLTVTALYNYLHAAFRKNKFSVCYWRLSEVAGKTYLKKAFCRYAEGVLPGDRGRRVRVDRQEFQICRAYQTRTPIATASVVGARLAGAWIDFDGGQKRSKRGLVSALQVPVYYVDAGNDRHCVGVLSLDSNRPDTFMPEELVHWQDDLVGFLVNIALAERMREVHEGRSKEIRRLRR
jgi:hypothetical protein